MHEVEGIIDLFERHRVRDQIVDIDFTFHVPVDDLGHVRPATRTAEGSAAPDTSGYELEWTGRDFLTGSGDVPMKAQIDTLVKGGYQGYYCFEWEKKWHPEIEEPEVSFPHYARVMTGYLRDAGVGPS